MEDAGNFFSYFAATQTLLYLQNQEASTCCNIITFWGQIILLSLQKCYDSGWEMSRGGSPESLGKKASGRQAW